MDQRRAVRAAAIVTGLALIIAVLVPSSLTGFVGAAPDGAECDLSGAIPIDAQLFNPNEDASRPNFTIDLPQPITAGTYSVTLVSFDDHSEPSEQTEERWFVQLLDVDDRVVYESDPTSDLPDGQNFLPTTFVRQPVRGTATRLQAVHLGAAVDLGPRASVNSIFALCALFTHQGLGRIIVEKVTEPAGADQRFTFTADYGDFELRDGERHASGPIPVGTHRVSEGVVGGWEAAAVCSDGSAVGAIDLQEGEIVTCTFTNTESKLDLAVTLEDAPRSGTPTEPIVTTEGSFDYVVNVMNLGPAAANNVQAVLILSGEVTADIGALGSACKSAAPDEIVCSVGAVPVGAIVKIRVAVRAREDSDRIGTDLSSVIVGEEGFPGERSEPNNRDVEPTMFPAGRGIG